MILIVSNRKPLINSLKNEISSWGAATHVVSGSKQSIVEQMYRTDIAAVLFDVASDFLPVQATADLLNGLGQRLPVIAVAPVISDLNASKFSEMVTVIQDTHLESVMATLHVTGALGVKPALMVQNKQAISYYSPHAATKMLIENGSFSVLTIDASSFRKIEVDYGSDVYSKVKDVFQQVLHEMWGKPGCFRLSDVLTRRSDHGNIYHVFLNRSRTTGYLPLPGILEAISDRLARMIQNAMWQELRLPAAKRRLPANLQNIPRVVVGYGSAIFNPCLDAHEIVAAAIENSSKFATIQVMRNLDRHRELMVTLIQSDSLLQPHFQAVFKLSSLTRNIVEQAIHEKSINVLAPHLYAFESLIRVRREELLNLIGQAHSPIDPTYLTPDVLFETAKQTKVAVELDQTCLRLALAQGRNLPGYLMINILPRNLYFMKYLQSILQSHSDIILEVSESETINNLDLLDQIREQLGKQNILIAADDFGRAFAGLDRIIQMRPHLIKFDRSLIENIHKDPVKHSYVDGLVSAARMLGTEVLAEGVEQIEEMLVLQAMGIDYIQGFLLHRPQEHKDIVKQLGPNTLKIDSVA